LNTKIGRIQFSLPGPPVVLAANAVKQLHPESCPANPFDLYQNKGRVLTADNVDSCNMK